MEFRGKKGLSENMENDAKTPEQKALEDLQRFRKRSDVEIDYKAEFVKVEGGDSFKILSALDSENFVSSRVTVILPNEFVEKLEF